MSDSDQRPETGTVNPGDDAPPGTPGTDENPCPCCNGRGTGKVIEGVGGA